MEIRDELLAEVGPKTHVAELCGRAADELLIKQMKIDQQQREIVRLRACLENTRDEICEGPVDDVLWHSAVPACTTVDNITLALDDGWTYDGWLEAKETQE